MLSRSAAPVALGVIAGAGLTTALTRAVMGELSVAAAALVSAYAVAMLALCLLPGIGPLRRALKVDATEALRAEA
jgi:hypothetical protein